MCDEMSRKGKNYQEVCRVYLYLSEEGPDGLPSYSIVLLERLSKNRIPLPYETGR